MKALDGPTLVRKGTVDTICDGHTTLVCDEPGSNRRAGGQVPFLWAIPYTNWKASMDRHAELVYGLSRVEAVLETCPLACL